MTSIQTVPPRNAYHTALPPNFTVVRVIPKEVLEKSTNREEKNLVGY